MSDETRAPPLSEDPPTRAVRGAGGSGLDLPVVVHTLKNGLTLLILPWGSAPIATFYTQFNIGSVHERPGVTGVSHLPEHMLKKGTTRVGTLDWDAERALFPRIDAAAARLHEALRREGGPEAEELAQREAELQAMEDAARQYVVAEEYDLILKRNGARGRNATTSVDRTNFFVSLPVERAEVWFALEADRLKSLVFRDFYRERDVVMEERRRNYETQPWGMLREALYGAAFTSHPYGRPTIGYMRDLVVMDRPLVEAHFRRYYGACNCVAAVVGRVDPQEMIALAERYLGEVGRGEPIPPVTAVEPAQTKRREVRVSWDAEPHLMMAWKVPPMAHPDSPALAVLSAVLTEGRAARLYRDAVVNRQLATDIGSSMGPGQVYDRLFVISALPRLPHTAGDVVAYVGRALEELKRAPISAAELARVQSRREAQEIRRLQSNLGLAWQLGISQGLWGDWRWTFDYSARMAQVTAEDVTRVAQRYLRDETLTVAVLSREPS